MNKDIEIERLKYAIQQFQEYDKGRGNTIKELRSCIDVLQDEINELKKPLSKKERKRVNLVHENRKLEKKINQLELVIQHEGYRIPIVGFEWAQWKVEVENRKLKEQNKALEEKVVELNNTIRKLLNLK